LSQDTSDETLDEHPSLRFKLAEQKAEPKKRARIEENGRVYDRLETPISKDEINMDEFPGNSKMTKGVVSVPPSAAEPKPEKKIEKVVSGEVQRRKPTLGKRIKTVFMGGDSQSVKDYVLLEVIIPAFKDTIADAVTGGIERMIFGESYRPRPGRRGAYGPGAHNAFNYAAISARNAGMAPGRFQNDPRNHLSRQAQGSHTFDEVIFPSRADAEAVLTQMFELLDQFEVVAVSDFLELSGVSGNFTDHRFGWTDLRGVQAHRTRGGGYILGLPPTEPID
jgi:hypothetical protein